MSIFTCSSLYEKTETNASVRQSFGWLELRIETDQSAVGNTFFRRTSVFSWLHSKHEILGDMPAEGTWLQCMDRETLSRAREKNFSTPPELVAHLGHCLAVGSSWKKHLHNWGVFRGEGEIFKIKQDEEYLVFDGNSYEVSGVAVRTEKPAIIIKVWMQGLPWKTQRGTLKVTQYATLNSIFHVFTHSPCFRVCKKNNQTFSWSKAGHMFICLPSKIAWEPIEHCESRTLTGRSFQGKVF